MKKKVFTILFALVAIATTAQAQENTIDGHEYVDLGLPSGTLWATCNVGANSPEDYGDYFAWGETKPKEDYSWENYKWCNGSSSSLTKYNTSSNYGTVDRKEELDFEDDAANANWGGNWRMPTIDEVIELFTKTSFKNTEQNGVKGYKVTGPNGNSIFLPYSYYWSSSLSNWGNPTTSFAFGYLSEYYYVYGPQDRCKGNCVRPVITGGQSTGIFLNSENFPDTNFRAALASILKISEGKEIPAEKIAATTDLNVSSKSISDLTGIEHFTALTYLSCFNNQLTSIDVSKNTALTKLGCYNNQLTSIDVSQNTALTYLSCFNNQLTSIDVSKNTALSQLFCDNNQLTSLDVSGCTALISLYCEYNQLTSLDVSKNTVLTTLHCNSNQLASLDVSKNTALISLYCYNNQLTSLDVSQNTAMKWLYCFSNQIKGEAMDALVASLPTLSLSNGSFEVIDTKDENEGNVCTKAQVAVAKEKGWGVYDKNGGSKQKYEGSDEVEQEINPVDENDNVDFGSDMDENDDLNGTVIRDIYYNIGDGKGEYNADEGCIVLKKTTSDETVDGLSGKDIFGEDFKGQFTGIVFKVPAGKGTVKVTAETTGNMLLKVKIGDGEPVEMELNGKLKISFPYNVSETTLVAIYAGANNEAKGFGTTNGAEDAALKIYGIEFERGETTAIGASLNDNGKMTNDNYYSIDGVKLNGEPRKKGVYIHKGKKVKK